jgi:hypothetical protein
MMKPGSDRPQFNRRGFLRRAALGCGALAGSYIIPSTALGRSGAVAPSERIIVGGIGIGGRGSGDLAAMLGESDVQVVAVCDVSRARREAVKNMVDGKYGHKDCAVYRDLRDLLAERTDVEAMLIATGDRWHATASIMAMKAGKDVFCEKPCTMNIAEGQALVATARRYGRIFQGGMQRLSEANFVFAAELVRTGRLGKVHAVLAHTLPWRMRTDYLPAEPEPPKDEFDWDLWLGPCPWRPYNKGYLGGCGAWLDYYDFGTGVAGWGSHTIAQCQQALGLAETSPVTYEYCKSSDAEGQVSHFLNGVKLIMTMKGWHGSCGVRYEGSEGWVSVADGYERPEVSTASLLANFRKVVDEYQSRTGWRLHHVRDFLDSVRSRRRCVANEVVAHRTMSTNHAINAAMLLARDVKLDVEKEEFINDPEANRLRARASRSPWRL